jgi:hypothetical protein
MTTRASIFALTALAAVSAMAIATTAASADGLGNVRFLPQRPIYTPTAPAYPSTQVIANCNGDPRLGCAVHIEPSPSTPVAACPWRFHAAGRVVASVPYELRLRTHFRVPFAAASYPRHHVWY